MKLRFHKLIIITLLFNGITFNILLAQKKLEGFLVDKVTNQPVPFAHLEVKGEINLRTISNEEGFFKLESEAIADIDTLLITHINYVSQSLLIQTFREQSNSKILLSENIIELKEIQINASEDYQAFEDIVIQTKKNLHFPMSANLYYRELVKENKSFNKFADGLLTVVYEKIDDENKVKIRVDQCRTEKLPKDEEDQFELVSPVKIEAVLGHEFGNFLNRFRKENQINYHFYSLNENIKEGERLIIIEPKKEADRSDDKLLYRATLKVDKDNNIREAQIDMDSLCHFEKSILGLKYAIIRSKVLLTFKETNGIYHLAFARLNFVLKFTTKKFQQTEDFVSEFVTIDVTQEAKEIAKADVFKKSALYKHPNKYVSPFWKGLNLPIPTKEEERLILELENKEKAKGGAPK